VALLAQDKLKYSCFQIDGEVEVEVEVEVVEQEME
jgi:hypothetical protein